MPIAKYFLMQKQCHPNSCCNWPQFSNIHSIDKKHKTGMRTNKFTNDNKLMLYNTSPSMVFLYVHHHTKQRHSHKKVILQVAVGSYVTLFLKLTRSWIKTSGNANVITTATLFAFSSHVFLTSIAVTKNHHNLNIQLTC